MRNHFSYLMFFFALNLNVTLRQVWGWLFKSCEVNGRILLREGFIDVKDIDQCIVKGDCKKLGIKLPAWSILQCLLASAKSNSQGLLICISFLRAAFFFNSSSAYVSSLGKR